MKDNIQNYFRDLSLQRGQVLDAAIQDALTQAGMTQDQLDALPEAERPLLVSQPLDTPHGHMTVMTLVDRQKRWAFTLHLVPEGHATRLDGIPKAVSEYLDHMPVQHGGPCPHCLADPQPKNSSPRNCAFLRGVFSKDNWRCGTVELIRRHMYDNADEQFGLRVRRDDYSHAALFVMWGEADPVSDTFQNGVILAQWYKDRGTTDTLIWGLHDDPERQGQPLTLTEALEVVEGFSSAGAPIPAF